MTTIEQRAKTLKAVAEAWDKYPQYRLGQLLINVTEKGDLFYVRDSGLESYLREYGEDDF